MIALLLSIFAITSIGFFAGKIIKPKNATVKTITDLLIFIFLPSLILTSTLKTSIDTTMWLIILSAVLIVLGVGVIAYAVAYYLNINNGEKKGFLLSSMFMNAGSMGSTICLFIYGPDGFMLAILFYIISQLLLYTIGVAIASDNDKFNFRSLKPVFTLPLLYAMIFGIVINMYKLKIPEPLLLPVQMLAQATIPLILLSLGIHLSMIKVELKNIHLPVISSAIRIIGGVFIAILLTTIFQIDGIMKGVLIIIASMPSKITIYPIASKFDSGADVVSMGILISTALSFVTVPLALFLIGMV